MAMKTISKKYQGICEALGWNVQHDDDGVTLSQTTPHDGDFSFTVDVAGFVENVKDYANSFDHDDYVKMWMEARENGVRNVPSTRELVQDAEAIQSMLDELTATLSGAKPDNTIWLRVGMTLRVTEEEAEALLGRRDRDTLVRILKEHRATPDGDSYIPDPCVADYNQKYGTDYKVGDVDFELSPSEFS